MAAAADNKSELAAKETNGIHNKQPEDRAEGQIPTDTDITSQIERLSLIDGSQEQRAKDEYIEDSAETCDVGSDDVEKAATSKENVAATAIKGEGPKNIACRFFSKNACKYAEDCLFSHDPNAPQPRPKQDRRNREGRSGRGGGGAAGDRPAGSICMFWQQGRCRFGVTCRFTHVGPAAPWIAPNHQNGGYPYAIAAGPGGPYYTAAPILIGGYGAAALPPGYALAYQPPPHSMGGPQQPLLLSDDDLGSLPGISTGPVAVLQAPPGARQYY